MRIEINKPELEELEELDVFSWPVWGRDEEKFEWYYDKMEQCYIISGEATIVSEFESVTIKSGDYVIFPAGLECVWDIHSFLTKHYLVD